MCHERSCVYQPSRPPSPSSSSSSSIIAVLRRIASHTSGRGGTGPGERPPINGLGPDLLPSRYSLATAFRPPPLPHHMQQPRSPAAAAAMAPGVGGVEPAVTLDQVPRWSDPDQRLFPAADEASSAEGGSEPPPYLSFSDPLTGDAAGRGGGASRFPVDQEINSRIYIWRGHPWNLEVDAVVNSTNEVGRDSFPCPPYRFAAGELGTIAVLSPRDLLVFLQSLDEAHSSPGLHAAAGSGLAEECATLVLLFVQV
jgi:hypothetical protein